MRQEEARSAASVRAKDKLSRPADGFGSETGLCLKPFRLEVGIGDSEGAGEKALEFLSRKKTQLLSDIKKIGDPAANAFVRGVERCRLPAGRQNGELRAKVVPVAPGPGDFPGAVHGSRMKDRQLRAEAVRKNDALSRIDVGEAFEPFR